MFQKEKGGILPDSNSSDRIQNDPSHKPQISEVKQYRIKVKVVFQPDITPKLKMTCVGCVSGRGKQLDSVPISILLLKEAMCLVLNSGQIVSNKIKAAPIFSYKLCNLRLRHRKQGTLNYRQVESANLLP